MGSFSAWMQHEATGEETAPNAEPSAVNDGSLSTSHWVPEADDILNFSRGASAGDAVHALLERADFTQPSTWPRAAVAALQLHPQPQPTATEPAVMLLRMMEQLAATELAPGVRLGDIAPAQRRHEFEFDLSIPHADMRAFAQALADSGLPMPRLSPTVLNAPFRGHLRGVIDLVFEHRGRYHLIDWKSNHLGQTPDAYHDAGMHNAMVKHGYHLQLALYALALQRHLRRVLGPAPARAAWGGAYVLFVRGVRPDWRQADGRPAGVCRQPLDFDQLQALDAQLANCGQATAP